MDARNETECLAQIAVLLHILNRVRKPALPKLLGLNSAMALNLDWEPHDSNDKTVNTASMQSNCSLKLTVSMLIISLNST